MLLRRLAFGVLGTYDRVATGVAVIFFVTQEPKPEILAGLLHNAALLSVRDTPLVGFKASGFWIRMGFGTVPKTQSYRPIQTLTSR